MQNCVELLQNLAFLSVIQQQEDVEAYETIATAAVATYTGWKWFPDLMLLQTMCLNRPTFLQCKYNLPGPKEPQQHSFAQFAV